MKQLISNNPVLRFKLGLVILKFLNGKYIVKKGDNLTKIAKSNGLSLEELLKLNPQIKNLNLINVGQEIKINKTSPKPRPKLLDFSKPQFESKQITAAKEWGLQGRLKIQEVGKVANTRNELLKKAMQKSESAAKLQDKLWKAGFYGNTSYEKAVDGDFGPKSKAALTAAELAGYTVNRKNGTITKGDAKQKNAVQTSFQYDEMSDPNNALSGQWSSKLKYLNITEIDPNLKDDFALWLYNLGSKKPVRNILDVVSGLVKNAAGIGNSLNISDGTIQLAIALHLYDKDDIYLKGDTLYHSLGYIPGTLRYKLTLLSGKEGVHNGDDLFTKTLYEPATHTLGRYNVTETPNDYNILDLYNFNDSGTLYALDIENPTTYDKIRYWAGASGANKDLEINKTIPKKTVLNWYKQFLKERES